MMYQGTSVPLDLKLTTLIKPEYFSYRNLAQNINKETCIENNMRFLDDILESSILWKINSVWAQFFTQ